MAHSFQRFKDLITLCILQSPAWEPVGSDGSCWEFKQHCVLGCHYAITMTRCLALVLLLSASVLGAEQESTSGAFTVPDCEPPFERIGKRCVYIHTVSSGTWQDMRNLCHSFGGDLIVLDSGDLFAAIVAYIHGSGLPELDYWIGATDEHHEGVWAWVDGSPMQMGTPFWGFDCHGNQFPDGNTNHNCAILSKSYSLNMDDIHCYEKYGYPICEM